MKCSNCGSEIKPVHGHCSVCGAPILEEIDYNNVPAYTPDISGQKQEHKKVTVKSNEKRIKEKKQKSKINKKLIVGMAAFAIIFGIVCNLGLFVEKDGQNPNTGNSGSESYSSIDTDVYREEATKLMVVDGVIYNNAGKSLEGMYPEDSFSYPFSYNIDHSAGVLIDAKDTAVYVTADLKTIPVEDDALRAETSLFGDNMYVISYDEGEYYIYIVDAKNNKKYLIDKDIASIAVISTDGSKVAYLKYTSDFRKKSLYVAGIDMKPQLIVEGAYDVRAVSNDGGTVFYQEVDDEFETHEFVWNNGKSIEFSNNRPGYFIFNRDCSEAIFRDSESNYYYKAGMDEAYSFDCGSFYRIIMDVKKERATGHQYDGFVYDTDSFAGGIFYDSEYDTYLLNEDYSITKLGHDFYGIVGHARRDDRDIYYVMDEKNFIRYDVDSSGNMESRTLLNDVTMENIAMNDDGSKVWCLYYGIGGTIFSMLDEDGTETILNQDYNGVNIDSIVWDTDSQKLYYCDSDNKLRALSDDGTVEEISDKCESLMTGYYEYPDNVMYTGLNNRQYVSVFGNFIMLQD